MGDIDPKLMRICGRILRETLKFLTEGFVRPGHTTLELSLKAEEIIRSYRGALPAFKGYRGYPEALCVSINQEVVHAVPSANRVIQEGDIVSIDCGVVYKDHFTDACRTFGIGTIDPRTKKLIKITSEALNKGIAVVKVGSFIGDISYAIQKHVERHRFNVSLDFIGHGIGRELHGPPAVPNYGPPGRGERLEQGTCLAIEPVVFDGPIETILQNDHWTVLSKNSNLSAHFEDTIIITNEGSEILTR